MKYYLGIDGGRSKTAGALLDADGRILSEACLSGSAIFAKPSKKSLQVLKSLTGKLCKTAGIQLSEISHLSIGLSGIDFEDEFDMQFQTISSYLEIPENKISLLNDGIVALWGASSSPASVILQHGSCFTSAFRSDYGKETLYDHLGVCTCYDMRDEALAATATIIAKDIKNNAFKNAVLDLLGVTEKEFPILLYKKKFNPEKERDILLVIYDLFTKHDPDASMIIHKATECYINLISGMAHRCDSRNVTTVLGGGVLKLAPEKFWGNFKEKLQVACPDINIQRAKFSPAIGAGIMAAFHSGENIGQYYDSVLKKRHDENA